MVKYQLNLIKKENRINGYLIDTEPILPMLVSKMYWLVSVYQIRITKVEIWVNWYLTDVTDTNWYLTDI